MLKEHLGYVADAVRLEGYRAAIAQAVKPGDRIVDLGCGTGVLGLLCLQAGAGHVDFIDSSPMLEVARQSMASAGFTDRCTFYRGLSQHVILPERADLVICDQVGYFGFDYGILGALQDARERFLEPTGKLMPCRIGLQLAAVESESCRKLTEAWGATGIPEPFHWLREHAVNAKHGVDLKATELLGPASDLAFIDLLALQPAFFSWNAELRIARDGRLHGLAGWFDCELTEALRMTNSPATAGAIDRHQAFLPLDEEVPVKAGDIIKAKVMARPGDNVLAWRVEIPSAGKTFKHSTWQGELLSADDLERQNPAHRPMPSDAGRARAEILSYCDGHRSVKEIEAAVLRDHPTLFPSEVEIIRFVSQVLAKDCR